LSLTIRSTWILTAILLVVLIGTLPGASAAGGQWIEYTGNPVLTPTPGGWDSDAITSPRVLYDGHIFRMWYQGVSRGVAAIGYATSTDGTDWTKHNGPVLTAGSSGAWDSSAVALGSVIWNGTHFLMWYSGSSPVAFPNGAFGFATSTDGISWTKYHSNPILKPSAIDQKYMADPYVISLNLTYNMWYAGRSVSDPASSEITRIIYATSFDGITWRKWPSTVLTPSTDPTSWDSVAVYSPSVIFNGSIFGMWYAGLGQSLVKPQIGFAASPDGATWTKSSQNPILSPGPLGSWDSAGVEQPGITIAIGYMLYYDGYSNTTRAGIGLAHAPQGFNIPEFPETNAALIAGFISIAVTCLMRRPRASKKSPV
jgi:predicted GH43/DUF377 family glycosyl hydrolase